MKHWLPECCRMFYVPSDNNVQHHSGKSLYVLEFDTCVIHTHNAHTVLTAIFKINLGKQVAPLTFDLKSFYPEDLHRQQKYFVSSLTKSNQVFSVHPVCPVLFPKSPSTTHISI